MSLCLKSGTNLAKGRSEISVRCSEIVWGLQMMPKSNLEHQEISPHSDPAERSAQIPRAPRFPIQAPAYYRVKGDLDWHEGTVVNISRTGILFRIHSDLLPQTIIEVRVLFSEELAGESPASVICRGRILRKEFSFPPHGWTVAAAAISHYRFRQEGEGLVHLPTRWRSATTQA